MNTHAYIRGAALALAGTLALGSGCSDYLELEPQNVITLEQFWNEESDVTNSIAGCYSALQSYGSISRMLVWGEFRSENVVNNGTITDDVSLERVLKENITASNAYTTWNTFYDVINRCNIIMHYAPAVAAKDPSYSASELAAHMAECTALRSLCYFYLIRAFRDVPYTEEPYLDDAQEMAVPAERFDVVLDHLIASLEAVKGQAVTKYPKTNDLDQYYQTGRVTKLAIYAMLCDMYLWKQDYANCIKYADLIIDYKLDYAREQEAETDFSDWNGFPLIATRLSGYSDSYGRAFNENFVSGNSSESIFELTFVKGNDNMLSNGPYSNFYGNASRSGYVKPSDYVAQDVQNTNPVVYNNRYDGRAYENFFFNTSGDPQMVNKFVCMTSIQLGNPISNSFYSNLANWGARYPTYGTKYESRNKSNFIFYRLTDIMLLKAEALAQQMSDASTDLSPADESLRQQAFVLVNAVNKRALYQTTPKDTLLLANYPNKAYLTDLIYDERERELMFEGKRYFDLVRRSRRDGNTDYLRSKVKQKAPDNASVVESFLSRMDAIYWPYNLEETKVNPNLVQNPAFGSGENSSYEATTEAK